MTIYPHANLPLARMRLEPRLPDIAIIDESFFMSCVEKFEVSLSLLRAPFLGPVGSQLCGQIERALTQGVPLLTHLYADGLEFEHRQQALSEIRQGAPTMHPRMGQKKRRAALQVLRQRTITTITMRNGKVTTLSGK